MWMIWCIPIGLPIAWFTLEADAQAYVESKPGYGYEVRLVTTAGSWHEVPR